ncbi:MAG: enoyl-CoA hydratase-related protein [Thermoplasmata archaeon]
MLLRAPGSSAPAVRHVPPEHDVIQQVTPPSVIAVLGSGNMGNGIAQSCAQAGFTVRVRDVSDDMLARGRGLLEKTLEGGVKRRKLTPSQRDAILARVEFTTDLGRAVSEARVVIEAVFEDEAVKREVFQAIQPLVRPETWVATNTSSLSVARLAEGFPNPERFGGLHFFFPAAVNRLVEVIGGPSTSEVTLAGFESLSYRLRKVPIRVRDSPGFAVNRYFVPYLNEATRLAQEEVASFATIEQVGREAFGTTLGPFELMNVTGIPIAYHSETSLARGLGPAYAPTDALRRQFESGQPWDWASTTVDPSKFDAVRDRFLGLVFGISTRLVEEGVASPEAVDRGAKVGLRWSQGPFARLSEAGLPEGVRLVEGYAKPMGGAFPVSAELRARVARGETTWPLRFVRVEREGPVVWVLLDRPEVLNSLNSAVLSQLSNVFSELDEDRSVRVVVLAGSSPVFAAGADVAEMARKDLAVGREFGFVGQAVCRQIDEFHAPVIALVEGYALGGGLELALACDFILAAEGAQLGLPEVSLGIHPGMGGASRLTRLIGPARAKLLILTGTPVDTAEAARLGFVARVLPSETARVDAQQIAHTIAERAPLGVQWAKSVIRRGMDASLDTALRLEGESAGHTFGTSDRTEGMSAFLEKRKPKFEGR